MAIAMKVAAMLLVVGLSGQLVAANGCLAGIKGVFCGHAAAKNYKILAEHLHKATQSRELADNTKAAESLLGEHPNANGDLIELVNAFKSLKDDESDLELMCGKVNLGNMRLVAQATRAGGNLEAKENTGPVERLNLVVLGALAHARAVCPAYLETRWPKRWSPKFTNKDMRFHIDGLCMNSKSLLYAAYKKDSASERNHWAKGLSFALENDVLWDLRAGRNIVPECGQPESTTDKVILKKQLHEYVYKPCREFVDFQEAREVLEPYGDLMMAWFAMIDYHNAVHFSHAYDYHKYDAGIRALVYAHGVCKRILDMPVTDIVSQVRKSRKYKRPY